MRGKQQEIVYPASDREESRRGGMGGLFRMHLKWSYFCYTAKLVIYFERTVVFCRYI